MKTRQRAKSLLNYVALEHYCLAISVRKISSVTKAGNIKFSIQNSFKVGFFSLKLSSPGKYHHFKPENKGRIFLRNVAMQQEDYMVLQLRKSQPKLAS
jgi:hypothetical protein